MTAMVFSLFRSSGRLMLGTVGDLVRQIGIDIRVIEQPEPEFRRQNFSSSAVEFAFRHNPLLHLIEQRAIDRTVGQIVIHARGNGQARRISLGGRDMMRVHQHLQAVTIGRDETVETPLLPQNLPEQPVIDVRGDAVDFVIGGHHASHVAFLDRGLEGHQECFANRAFGVICRRGVGTALGLSVSRKVLHRSHHVVTVDEKVIALQPSYSSDGHTRDEIRVFSIGFFCAAPSRIARQIEHRAENLSRSARTSLIARGGEHLLHEFGVKGAGEANCLRKTGAAVFHKSMQGLAHEQRRNT